ncbi:ECF transporter S component [Vagococcus sp. DIV0080]|uniref:Riboflavin transporter n=1 Tax=Candidatus Vagococcus giribetii TaxID=2230876 RepID=A0ABS3HST1_9ENTE|nr:ECF transporter S component [Vagococcus sp. DIV0080]MBO0476815.1 ECF transporter S component [Vagococcus sp. DIV0080]
MRKRKTEKMVVTALLASFSYLLLFLEIPILPTFGWLKLDFSDIPILIGSFILGPLAGITIAFIRSLLNFMMSGGDVLSLIGNATGFIASVIFMLPIYFMVKKENTNKNLFMGMIISSISLIVFMSIANYFVITPLYISILGMDFGMPIAKMVLYGIVPFNIIKSIAVSIVFYVSYKKLVPSIEKKMSLV